MANADRNQHGVGHSLLVIVLEAVLSQQDFILLIGVGNLNGLAVASTHSQLLSTVSSLVDIDLALHTSLSHQTIINSTELL